MNSKNAARTARRIAGIDIGGTFTDLLLYADDRAGPSLKLAKIPTTVANQAEGVLAAIAATGVSPADIDLLIHGTTATTNAVLERKVAKVGLITTRGFRDVLELGRRTRPKPYGMTGTFEPLISREFRLEVTERMNALGEVVTALAEDQVRACVQKLRDAGCEALVIHFLHAYANPAHEQRAAVIAREIWPNEYVTCGAALLSEYREYERGTTASVNAAVQPILDRYVRRLERDLAAGGFAHDLLIMNGNGGTVAARHAIAEAAKTVMSGPASGVMAAAATLAASGLTNAITYDMGGTSTDVALIHGGIPEVSAELTIDYGLPIHVPMVDVRTVGAGGGSIAYVDAAGMLKVGPESAGATPGPICFRPWRRAPDHHRRQPDARPPAVRKLTAVTKRVSLDAIRAIFKRDLADPLGMSVDDAAAAVLRLANARCRTPSAWSRCRAGTIRGISCCSRSAVRGHCTPARSRVIWDYPKCSFQRAPA